MNTAQSLLAAYQNPQHESHNDLRALLSDALAKCTSADQHFDGGTIQYTFPDSSDLTVRTFKKVEHSTTDSISLDVKISCSK